MKYFLLNGEIDCETIQPVLDFIGNNEGELQIGICSGGGDNDVMRFLQDALNANAERVTLVAMQGIYSAAFEIFVKYSGKRKMTTGTRGMYHYSGLQVRNNALGVFTDEEERTAVKFNRKYRLLEQTDLAKRFMTPAEFKKFRSSKDVYFDFERMKEICPNCKII